MRLSDHMLSFNICSKCTKISLDCLRCHKFLFVSNLFLLPMVLKQTALKSTAVSNLLTGACLCQNDNRLFRYAAIED